MQEIPSPTDVLPSFIDVWTNPELLEQLFSISERGLYQQVHQLFKEPIDKMPDYFLLTISKCNFTGGNLLLDEVLSTLMPIFLTNQASINVLRKLWDFNQ